MHHMFENRLFAAKQFGLIRGRSTMLQLLRVIDEWTDILDNGWCFDVIYMNFQKAFDTVPHRRLITKFCKCGITGGGLHWIMMFLTNRKQRVVVNDAFSR